MQAPALQTAPDPRRWWALALLCGAFFMVILDAAIVTVALPSIEEDLGFSAQGLQWVVSAYALTFAGLLLLGGRAADLLGRRRVFMVGLVVFTVASLLCGLAWSDGGADRRPRLPGHRCGDHDPDRPLDHHHDLPRGSERNKALGIWGALGGIGATTAWLIGGPLVDGPGWEWIFFINIPVGLAALALSPVLLRESRAATARRSYDPAGSAHDHGRARPCSSMRSSRRPTSAGVAHRRSSSSPARPPCSDLLADRVPPPRAARAAAHLPLAHARRGKRRHARLRHAPVRPGVHPHALRPAGARLLGGQVRAHLARLSGHGGRRVDLRPGDRPPGRLPTRRRGGNGADGRRRAPPHTGLPSAAATSATSSSGCSSSAPASASPSSPPRSPPSPASPSTSRGSPPASATPAFRSARRSGWPSSRPWPSRAPRTTSPRPPVRIRSSR